MKDQYVGDHKDYYKYSFLSYLSEQGDVKVNVCWMLTGDEHDSPHGQDLAYLEMGDEWRPHDETIFDLLEYLVDNARRRVQEVEQSCLIPNASFYRKQFSGGKTKRRQYFMEFGEQMPHVDKKKECYLIFFDADKGFRPRPKTLTNRHVYLDEVSKFYRKGYSIFLIQFSSWCENIGVFAERRVHEVSSEFGEHVRGLICCLSCRVIKGHSVLFFLISQEKDLSKLSHLVEDFVEKWHPSIAIAVKFKGA